MASVVSICNQAISWCGGNRIISLDDGTTEANICKDNYENLRDAVLEDGDWTFAMSRFNLAPEQIGPDNGYTYKFLLPSRVIRVISVSDSADLGEENNIPWDIEGGIVADSNIVYVKAIVKIEDPTKFSPGFTQALAARLCADALVMPLTGSAKKQADFWSLYNNKLKAARSNDGRQGRSQRIRSSWLKRAR